MRRRTRFHVVASRLHRWLALIVGAQILVWFASGALMSFLPIERVRGEHLVDRAHVEALPPGATLVSPQRLLAQAGAEVSAISWRMLDGRPVAEVTTAEGVKLFDAATGAQVPGIDARGATRIAEAAWIAPAKPKSVATFVTVESPEYRGALPAWRVAFGDADHTRVFVARDTGRIGAVRTGTWRIYDFFWGLHIMDWQNHENLNSWWLVVFAIGGLVLGLAGTALLLLRWPVRRKRRP